MEEGSGKSEAGEPGPFSRRQQGEPVMPGKPDIGGDGLVLRKRGAAHGRVPARAAMPGMDDERRAHGRPHRLEPVEKCRIVPVFPATEPPTTPAGQLGHGKVRPAPLAGKGRPCPDG